MDGSSLVVLGFGVCQDVGLEVGGLSELLIAAVERADVGPVSSVDAHVRAQVEVQGEPFPAAFEGALRRRAAAVSSRRENRRRRADESHLEGLLPRVDQLVALELGALHEGFPALGADVDARSVGVEMLPHGRVIPEHLCAALDAGGPIQTSDASITQGDSG